MNQAFLVLEQNGLSEGRPEVGTVTTTGIGNTKELRPGSGGRSEVRILFALRYPSAQIAARLAHVGRLRQIGLLGPAERVLAAEGEVFRAIRSVGRILRRL